jgi:LacI family transcriptional regulator
VSQGRDNICLFERIRGDIRGRIETGVIQPGEKIPSVKEIRDLYQVSHITALRALKELAQEGSVECVKGRGYFARRLEKSDAPGRQTSIVACLTRPSRTATVHDNFFNNINQAIQRELMRLKFYAIYPHGNLGLDEARPTPAEQEIILKDALELEARVDGFIVDERLDDTVLAKLMAATRKPLVVVNRTSNLALDTVTAANGEGGKQAAEIALKMGYERFLVASPGSGIANFFERHVAFMEALSAHGIPKSQVMVLEGYDLQPFEVSFDKIDKALCENKDKTLVFSPTDVFARAAADHLATQQLVLGDRVGVLGFEGMGYATMHKPKVTTFNIHPERIGMEAARLLCARINGQNFEAPDNHSVPCSLQMGDTL